MVHDVQAIREDLAFMRALAQEGRRAPLLIGYGLVASGLIFGAACVFCWLVEVRVLALPHWWEGVVWPIAIVVFMPAVRWWRSCATRDAPGATAVTNRAVGSAMRGLGYAMLTLMFASGALSYTLHTAVVFAMLPPVVLAIYGAAWMVAAAMSDVPWLKWVAAGCFTASVVTGFTVAQSYGFLVFAALLVSVTAVPGAALVRREPSRVV